MRADFFEEFASSGLDWAPLDSPGLYWTLLRSLWRSGARLGSPGLLGSPGISYGSAGLSRKLLSSQGNSWTLVGYHGLVWVPRCVVS